MLRGAMIAPNALVKQSTMQQLSSAQQQNDRIFFWVCSLRFSELSSSNKSQYEIGKNLRRCDHWALCWLWHSTILFGRDASHP